MPQNQQSPDDLLAAMSEVRAVLTSMDKLKSRLPKAKTIIEFHTERQKGLLAKFAAPLLDKGDGASDKLARAMPEYQAELSKLGKEYQDAQGVLVEWRILENKLEGLRSVVSAEKNLASLT